MRRDEQQLGLWQELRQTLLQQWGRWPTHRLELPQTPLHTATFEWSHQIQPRIQQWKNPVYIHAYPMPQAEWRYQSIMFPMTSYRAGLNFAITLQSEALHSDFSTRYHHAFEPLDSLSQPITIDKLNTHCQTKNFEWQDLVTQSLPMPSNQIKIHQASMAISKSRCRNQLDRVMRLEHSRDSLELTRFSREETIRLYRELVQASQLHPREIELIGVFPKIPEEAVTHFRLVQGRLYFALKRTRHVAASKMLVLGRNRQTRKWISVFMDEKEQ